MNAPPACAVWPLTAAQRVTAEQLAARLELPLAPPEAPPAGYRLLVDANGLRLQDIRPGAPGALRVAAASGNDDRRYRQVGAANESLLRAIGARRGQRPTVIDATAGLGRDALLMAAAGCQVTMIERSALLAAMLEHALGNPVPALKEAVTRLALRVGDAESLMDELDAADVIYLDPMYPDRNRRAMQGKEMRALQELLGPQPDPETLLTAALRHARTRVVVKRPRKAERLAGASPHHQIVGRSTRFDVYLPSP
ncbi:16S rRNA (guanine1516-N2)-methyltransferase [Natronocella acetinitrilica]|uniref:Ribosomal RNA small subunit methyltransferase J n=1 Tax=Natronocella acetinitrilica TaxID=414046 RepID=A0AAE3G258_9GAMM|nr:class I SAM-dependent methyltransferase [Natronocella acetinitrilica]MCP1673063.1 16S rRNA (guanine1516-N2)-methyltransferase [Natronocella acetinitrilica]